MNSSANPVRMQGKPGLARGVWQILDSVNGYPASLDREGVRRTNHGSARRNRIHGWWDRCPSDDWKTSLGRQQQKQHQNQKLRGREKPRPCPRAEVYLTKAFSSYRAKGPCLYSEESYAALNIRSTGFPAGGADPSFAGIGDDLNIGIAGVGEKVAMLIDSEELHPGSRGVFFGEFRDC